MKSLHTVLLSFLFLSVLPRQQLLMMAINSQQANARNTFVMAQPGAEFILPWLDNLGNTSSPTNFFGNAQTLNQIRRSTAIFPWQFEQADVSVFQVEAGLGANRLGNMVLICFQKRIPYSYMSVRTTISIGFNSLFPGQHFHHLTAKKLPKSI